MNKLYRVELVMLLATIALPIFCMDKNSTHIVNFEVEDGIVPIKKTNIALIKTLDEH